MSSDKNNFAFVAQERLRGLIAFEQGALLKRMKVEVPPDRRFTVAIDADRFIARCPQKTGIAIPLDFHAGARFTGAVIPLIEGMTGRARQITDIDLLKIVVEYLDIAFMLIIEREDIVYQFPLWMVGHGRYFVFRHVAF